MAGAPLPETFDEAARYYTAAVRELQPHGPYHLLGWSYGGNLAHAVACRLQELGAEVAQVALLDSFLLHDPTEAGSADDDVAAAIATLPSVGELSAAQAARIAPLVRHNAKLLAAAPPPAVFAGDLLLFTAQANSTRVLAPEEWAAYCTGRITEFAFPCTHEEITQPRWLASVVDRL